MSDHIGDADSRNAERIRGLEEKLVAFQNIQDKYLQQRGKLAIAIEALTEAHSLISSTGYTELENGAVKMCGNEWPWIPRGIAVMKEALAKIQCT